MKIPPQIGGALVAAADLFNSIPLLLLLVGHCLSCASFVRGKYGDRWLINNLAGFAIAFGGGSLSALLIQDPEHVPNVFFSGDVILVVWGLSWWAFYYSPFDVAGLAVLRAGIVAQRVDYTVANFPGQNIAAVIMGIIGSSGGGLIVDMIDIGGGYSRGPGELGRPGFSLRSGTFLSIFHLLTVHTLGLLSSQASLGFITLVLVGHTLASVLLDAPLDFTAPLGNFLHKVTNIPVPKESKAKPSPSKPVTRSQTAGGGAARGDAAESRSELLPATPTSSKKAPRRKTLIGKKD